MFENFIDYLHRRVTSFMNTRSGWLILAVAFTGVLVVSSFISSSNLINNADALVLNAIFSEPFKLDGGAIVQAQHTNLLKLPIFWIQNALNFDVRSFYLFNTTLVLATFWGWMLYLYKVFGKRVALSSGVVFCSFIAASPTASVDIGYTTVRNIEFVLAFLCISEFVKFVHYGIRSKSISDILSFRVLSATLLLSLLFFSDNFFVYTLLPAIALYLLYVALLYPRNKYGYRQFYASIAAFFYLAVAMVISVMLYLATSKLGLVSLSTQDDFAKTIVPWVALLPSVWETVRQILIVTGSFVFGREPKVDLLPSFVNGFVVIFSGIGAYNILKKSRDSLDSSPSDSVANLSIISLFWVITLLLYVFGHQVVSVASNGDIGSREQTRFLSVTLFVLPVLASFIYFHYSYKLSRNKLDLGIKKTLLNIVGLAILSSFTLGGVTLLSRYSEYTAQNSVARYSHEAVARELKSNNVLFAASGHWYGATTYFWMGMGQEGVFKVGPVKECNIALSSWVNKDWYDSADDSQVVRTALVVDRSGGSSDTLNWDYCSNERISAIYGEPIKRSMVADRFGGNKVEVIIYDYDVRTKIISSHL